MSRFVDLSHPIVDGMTTYPGLPAPRVYTHTSRKDSLERLGTGVSFHIGGIDLVANTGTYLDAPNHYDPYGPDTADLPLERLVDVPIVVVRAVGASSVGAAMLGYRDRSSPVGRRGGDERSRPGRFWGAAVLVNTGWSRHWGTDAYLAGGPYLTRGAARVLVDANAALVGIDALNIDDTADPERPVHSALLGNGIPILEHLTGLAVLPDEGARLTAVPAPVRGLGTFPVRAVARLS